jgi:hypothetical protein
MVRATTTDRNVAFVKVILHVHTMVTLTFHVPGGMPVSISYHYYWNSIVYYNPIGGWTGPNA